MDRRRFVKVCGSALALAAALPRRMLAGGDGELRRYRRVQLVDTAGAPIRADTLPKDDSFVFFYPYQSTPCYLIRLGALTQPQLLRNEAGEAYHWAGGVGPENTIVAFSAICTHVMTHPKPDISLINYHAEADDLSGRENVISCCVHGSVFDPASGGKVLRGPATQPLTAIELEHDPATTHLYAIGTRGGEVYSEFFDDFKRELRDKFGRGEYRDEADDTATVRRIGEYSDNVIFC